MPTEIDANLLITRTLNHLQRQYVPSYLGLRVLAESTAQSLRNDWTIGFIDRRCLTRRRQAYWKYSAVKGQDDTGKLEYRHFVVGSPTTTLTECRVISTLSRWPQFARHPAVYSYLWPSYERSGHLFAHFMFGYRKREEDVAAAIKQFPGHICIVLDLKNFYPSVDKQRVKSRFQARVSEANATSNQKALANYAVEQLLAFPEKGLPVGPPLSHVLANVALENVDREMTGLFPFRYFRYVDDVVIVVDPASVDAALRQFRTLVAADDLAVNETKTDFVAASQWSDHIGGQVKTAMTDTFGSLIRRLQVYCARSLHKWEATRRAFRDAGFSLPFSRLRSAATYGRFRRFLKILWRTSDWEQRISFISESPETLLRTAIEIRDRLLTAAEQAAAAEVPQNGMVRRWRIQELRFSFARLLYLLPFSEYKRLLELLPDIPECGELRVMLSALSTGDATDLLMRPGTSISTFAQLWKENATAPPIIRWSAKPEYAERDSAVALATYGVLPTSNEWISRIELQSNRQLLQIVNNISVEPFTPETPDFLRELHSLNNGWNLDERERLLKERFNNDEDVSLFGLELDGFPSRI